MKLTAEQIQQSRERANEVVSIPAYKLMRLNWKLSRARRERDRAKAELAKYERAERIRGNLGHLRMQSMLDDYVEANRKLREALVKKDPSILQRVTDWLRG